MQGNDIRQRFKRALPNAFIRWDEPMKNHTTFQIGGVADALLVASSVEEIQEAIAFAQRENIPCFIMGNGSNLLVRDGGIRGIVIKIAERMQTMQMNDLEMTVQAGCLLSSVAYATIAQNRGGFACIGGIPGTIGGAVTMNAGAYGAYIADCLASVTYLDESMQVKKRKIEPEDMGYRTTIFGRKQWIILEATFSLWYDATGEAKKRLVECNRMRREKQPLTWPSAGSTFKRPPNHFAGALIQEADCRGLRIGDAQVSEKHAGFIINRGQATASDVLELIGMVQERVYQSSGIWLEREVHVIGDENDGRSRKQ